MNKSKWILIACVCAAFVAGGVTGVALSRMLRHPPRPPIMEQLGLTPEQNNQMRDIWRDAMRPSKQQRERMELLRKERDEAILGLLDAEQEARYDDVMKQYAGALESERRKMIEDAVARTRAILTEPQWEKYQELRKEWERGGPHGPRDRPGGPGGEMPPPGGPPAGEPRP